MVVRRWDEDFIRLYDSLRRQFIFKSVPTCHHVLPSNSLWKLETRAITFVCFAENSSVSGEIFQDKDSLLARLAADQNLDGAIKTMIHSIHPNPEPSVDRRLRVRTRVYVIM